MKTRERRESVIGEAEIDLTPLIDCIFLLLIFFMVTTVFIDVKALVVDLPSFHTLLIFFMVTTVFIDVKALVVDLPSADASQDEQQQIKDVNILISASGEYTVVGEPVSATDLSMAIAGAMDLANNRKVIINGDEKTEHRYVVYAMDMAQGQGAEQMAFAIEQEEE